jgi:hypothetical protein
VLALLGVLALPGVHWRLVGWRRGEPFYRGRPASYWAGSVRKDGSLPGWLSEHGGRYYARPYDPLARLKKAFGLADAYDPFVDREVPFFQAGPDAVPVLTALLADPEPEVRCYAALALWEMSMRGEGQAARSAAPALRRLLNDDCVVDAGKRKGNLVSDIVSMALNRIDPDSVQEATDRP